jgi:methyl-accepting chemotaxis protein
VAGLDQSTQLNAAAVAASAAAANSLKQAAFMLSDRVSQFKVSAQLVATAPVQAVSAPLSGTFDFDAAIEAHRAWKIKLRNAISHHEKLDVGTISRDDCCPLGKWIHGPGGHHYGSKPRFVELQNKHRDFHRAVGTIAQSINDGQHANAEKLLGAGSAFTTISTDIVSVLTRFKRSA